MIAYIMIAISFLAGSLVAVLDPRVVNWTWFGPIILVGVIGVFILRRARHAEASAGHKVSGNLDTLSSSLANIASNLGEMVKRKDELVASEVRFEIDKVFREDLARFAEARESMIHRHGLRAYAEIMSAFAAGERYINRMWSASTDGYIDEIQMYLDKAHRQFSEASEKFQALS
jgi:hypothetical protein